MTHAFTSALSSVALAISLVASPAQASDFTRAEALVLVNRDARHWILNSDDFRLDIETLRIPTAVGEVGKLCGPIVPLRRVSDPRAFQSYSATLRVEGNKMVVAGLSPFFMSIDELIAADMCR